MDNRPIGLIDSGVGGFTVLQEIQQQLPNEDILYLGDSEHMPYGEKSNTEIIRLVNADIRFLQDKGVKLIVLACNTASSMVDHLDAEVPVFSILDAGCRAVIKAQPAGPVGLIATRATVNNRAYEKCIKKYTRDIRFIAYGTPTLAQVINDHVNELTMLRANIRLAIDPILRQCRLTNLLLGCTHYPIVKQTIKQMYPQLHLINPALEQAQIVISYLEAHDMAHERFAGGGDSVRIYITGGQTELDMSRNLLNELNIDFDLLENAALNLIKE